MRTRFLYSHISSEAGRFMADGIINQALYRKRIPDQHLLNAGLFGAWCSAVFDPSTQLQPLSIIWDNVETGVCPEDPGPTIGLIINLVAQYHTDSNMINVLIKRYGETPEPAYTQTEHGFSLTRKALIYLETYVFACMWPARRADLIETAISLRAAPKAPFPDLVRKWLLDVSMNMESSKLESGCRQIYCASKLPTAIAIRTNKTSYEQYRDLDALVSVPDFAEKIELVALNTPRDILMEKLATNDPIADASAILSVLVLYVATNCDIPLRIRSNRDAGIDWCKPPAIYFTDTEAYMCLREGQIVKPATSLGQDIVFAFFHAAQSVFPANDHIADVMRKLHLREPDPDMPEWAD